jgi:Zn-dependent M28 family amino/carboxypeptidase
MKLFIYCFSCCLICLIGSGQSTSMTNISETNSFNTALAPLRFLASDELMGRSSVRPEIHIAARYISEAFRGFGLKEVNGTNDYFQLFEIKSTNPNGIFAAKNVMGWVEGTDPKLKNEFIILSSHYDHLGVSQHPKMEEGKLDSIYNGTRDNAIGTTAVIDAARYFAKFPAKRSILFIAFSGEEMGLLGSKYFAEHPPLPLGSIVYDLNIDNASYNDTSSITLVGLGRTTADEDIKNACKQFDLAILPDPLAGRLFYGSDNTPLAEKGIPAPTYSLGMKSFDQSILNRYHQLSDEVGNFNLNYGLKFIHSYILAAENIANNPMTPQWTKGDKFEPVWKSLHQ